MTISFRGTGTPAINSLSPTPSYPAGVVATDISVLTVTAKANSGVVPQDVTCATPSGWTLLFARSSGNSPPSTPEAGSGSANIWIFMRTGGAFSGTVPLTLTNHSNAAAVIDTYAGTVGGWNTSIVYGYDNDSGAGGYDSNKTVASSNLNVVTGDWMLVHSALTNNASVGTVTLTATGATLASSTGTSRYSALSTITSPDTSYVQIDVRDVTVSSGTSTAGPRMQFTGVMDGISVFVLLREGTRAVSGSDTSTAAEVTNVGSAGVIPATTTWTNGDDLSAARLNTYISDPFDWLLNESPSAQVKCTTASTLTGAHTVVWNAHNLLRGGMRYSGTRVYAPVPGRYVGQLSAGFQDIGTMGASWYAEYLLQVYPAGSGTPTQKVRSQVANPGVETSWAWGSVPFEVYLNQNDSVEFVISGTWTSGGAALWPNGSSGEVQILMDLHWDGKWDGSFS